MLSSRPTVDVQAFKKMWPILLQMHVTFIYD